MPRTNSHDNIKKDPNQDTTDPIFLSPGAIGSAGSSLANAKEARPFNQVDGLINENQKLQAVIKEQERELLRLYRELHGRGY